MKTLRFWFASLLCSLLIAAPIAQAALYNPPAAAGGTAQVKAYKTGTVSYVAVSTTLGVSSTISIPANAFGNNAWGYLTIWSEQNGTTNSAAYQAHAGAAGFTPSGSTNITGSYSLATTNNRGRAQTFFRVDPADSANLLVSVSSNTDPTTITASTAFATRAVNRAATWEIKLTATTGSTDEARVYGMLIIVDPDA